MPTYQVKLIDNQPTFSRDRKPVKLQNILDSLEHGGGLKVLTPLEYHTDQQRKWYKGVCIAGLCDWNGETPCEWDKRLKDECGGNELLKKDE